MKQTPVGHTYFYYPLMAIYHNISSWVIKTRSLLHCSCFFKFIIRLWTLSCISASLSTTHADFDHLQSNLDDLKRASAGRTILHALDIGPMDSYRQAQFPRIYLLDRMFVYLYSAWECLSQNFHRITVHGSLPQTGRPAADLPVAIYCLPTRG